MQKSSKEPEFKRLADGLTAVAPRMSVTSRKPEALSVKDDPRSERIMKVVSWVEMAVQIKLDPEQRAHITRELADMDLPEVLINCAAYIIAGGFIEIYSRLDMALWRKAIAEVPHAIGKVNKFYRQGYSDAHHAVWREIRMGTYNKELKRILEETES